MVSTVPAWTVMAVRFQLGLVYFFAGTAKLNADWLLRAEPLKIWLAARTDVPIFGGLLSETWFAYVASYAGALFDLGVVWALLFRRTRGAAFVALAGFHVVTGLLLPIGMFPWIMIAGATVFLSPSWPRRFLVRLPSGVTPARPARVSRTTAFFVGVHCLVQTIVPLRAGFGGTTSAWTQQGFNFAWKVMVAEKSGVTSFRVRDRTGGDSDIVEAKAYLSPGQERAMAQDPEMIRALAVEIADDIRRRQRRDVSVFADAFASINGRPSARLVDPDVDLTGLLPVTWIRSLPEP
jgi:hypothetical protein